MAITQLYLFKKNGNVLGGGKAVLTGPSFVDKTNIDHDPPVRQEQHPLVRLPRGGRPAAARPAPRRTAHRSCTMSHTRQDRHRRRHPPRPRTASRSACPTGCSARPEIGALVAAIVIFIFFLIVAPAFRSPAVVLHRPLPVLDHRHRGRRCRHADDRRRVRPVRRRLVTTAGLVNAMFCYQLGINLWVGAILSLVFCLAIGFLNGYLVMRTGIPSFLITLGTFFILQGANLGVTKLVTGSVSSPNINQMDGYNVPELRSSPTSSRSARVTLTITVIWWFLFVGARPAYILQRTKIGNWIYAVGGNAGSAPAPSASRSPGSRSASS